MLLEFDSILPTKILEYAHAILGRSILIFRPIVHQLPMRCRRSRLWEQCTSLVFAVETLDMSSDCKYKLYIAAVLVPKIEFRSHVAARRVAEWPLANPTKPASFDWAQAKRTQRTCTTSNDSREGLPADQLKLQRSHSRRRSARAWPPTF